MRARVSVDAVAAGGYEVVVRIATGADTDEAAKIAQEIRERKVVDLRDPRWSA